MAKSDKTKKGMTHPSPAQHRNFNGFHSSRMGVTEAEGVILDLMRQARKAETSRKAYARFVAWEMLRSEVEAQRQGNMPEKIDTDNNPALYAAVTAIQSYLASEQAKTKAGAKRAKAAT